MLVGSCSGVFYALDRSTGAPVWSYDTGLDGEPAEFHGDCAVSGGVVVTGCDRTSVAHTYAFRLETGEVLWKQPRAALESDVVAVGAAAIGRRWNGDLVALDRQDGKLRWSVGPEDYTYRPVPDASPVEQGGTIYFGGVDGRVYAVDGGSGQVLWSADLEDAITTSPVTDGRDLYVGVAGDRLHRIDARTGERLGFFDLPERPLGRPVLGESVVAVLAGESELIAMDRDLQLLWNAAGGGSWTSYQPLLWGEVLVAGTRDGDVLAYDIATGGLAFALTVDGAVRGIGAQGEVLYIGTLGGTLWAVSP